MSIDYFEYLFKIISKFYYECICDKSLTLTVLWSDFNSLVFIIQWAFEVVIINYNVIQLKSTTNSLVTVN